MKYSNDSIDAVLELERQRTGYYEDDEEEENEDYSYFRKYSDDDLADERTDEWLYERDD